MASQAPPTRHRTRCRAGADVGACYDAAQQRWIELSLGPDPRSIMLTDSGTLYEAITALYVREINCRCEIFWDGGIRATPDLPLLNPSRCLAPHIKTLP